MAYGSIGQRIRRGNRQSDCARAVVHTISYSDVDFDCGGISNSFSFSTPALASHLTAINGIHRDRMTTIRDALFWLCSTPT